MLPYETQMLSTSNYLNDCTSLKNNTQKKFQMLNITERGKNATGFTNLILFIEVFKETH